MARIEPTRGPSYPQRGPEGKKASPELLQLSAKVMSVAKETHLNKFSPTTSSFTQQANDTSRIEGIAQNHFENLS